jgi:hypothetical protein
MHRRIIIYSNANSNAKTKLKITKEIKKELAIRHTKIISKIINNSKSKNSNQPRIELYGYDKTLKYTSKNVSTKTLKNMIARIDTMPMGEIEKKIRNID